MAENSLHLEQYKMLREEVMQHMREMYRTEFWGAAAIAAVFSFLFSSKQPAGNLMWFIPPLVILVCGVRTRVLFGRIRLISTYLQKIEKEVFAFDPKLPGWERYLKDNAGVDVIITATCIYAFALVGALAASLYFYYQGYNA
jgi:hypothetical protein